MTALQSALGQMNVSLSCSMKDRSVAMHAHMQHMKQEKKTGYPRGRTTKTRRQKTKCKQAISTGTAVMGHGGH
jgi:hypothetical protein